MNDTIAYLENLGYKDGDALYWRNAYDGVFANRQTTYPEVYEQLGGELVHLVYNGGGNKDEDIDQCRALMIEHDDLDKAEQLVLWKSLGMPEPTMQVDSNGKSIHTYWVFDRPVGKDVWQTLMNDLISYAKSDKACRNASRIIKVPGYRRGEELVSIVSNSSKRYSYSQLRASVPLSRYGDNLYKITAPTTQEWLAEGVSEGGRNQVAVKVAADLIGCESWLIENKIPYDHTAEEWFDSFCVRCVPAYDGQTTFDAIAKKDPTPTRSDDEIKDILKLNKNKLADLLTKLEAAQDELNELIMGEADVLASEYTNYKNKLKTTKAQVSLLKDQVRTVKAKEKLSEVREKSAGAEQTKAVSDHDLCEELLVGRIRYCDRLGQFQWVDDGSTFTPSYLALKRKLGFSPNLHNLSMVKTVACELRDEGDLSYNDISDYLNNLTPSDSNLHARLPEILFNLDPNSPETKYKNELMRAMLISAVSRGFEPGCIGRLCIILQGNQDCGKSNFIKFLFGEKYSGSVGVSKLDDRDGYMAANRHWGCELPEIDAHLSSYKSGVIKDFISKTEATFRTLFTETTQAYKRSGIVIGTTNKSDFLRDETGNTRFGIIEFPNWTTDEARAMLEQVKEMRNEIWASAVYGYQNGELGEISQEFKKTQADTNKEFEEIDEWSQVVEEKVKGYEFVEVLALAQALGIELAHFDRKSSARIHKILKRLGYESKSVYVSGKTIRCWVNKAVGGGLYLEKF